MSDNVVSHPHRDLMAEAKREREIADSAEGQVLQQAICKAVNAYSEFLEREGVIWEFGVDPADPNWPRMKAQALRNRADTDIAHRLGLRHYPIDARLHVRTVVANENDDSALRPAHVGKRVAFVVHTFE